MKKNLLLLLLVTFFAVGKANAQCGDLFISEYIEGWNNNKALEIYNPTDAAIDLSDYRLIRWSNGNASYLDQAAVTLSGTVEAKDVVVFVIDKQDCSLGGQDTCAWEGLQNAADGFLCADYNDCYVMYHNGNDAISLNKVDGEPGTFVDIFGVIGQDPGVSWTDEAPYTSDDSEGTYYSRNRTLVRKSSVQSGTTTNPALGTWNPASEWDTLAVNTFNHLGYHECECSGNVGVKENNVNNIVRLYPNPVTNSQFQINSKDLMTQVEVFNLNGQVIQAKQLVDTQTEVQLDQAPVGTYFVKITYQNGNTTFQKIMVR